MAYAAADLVRFIPGRITFTEAVAVLTIGAPLVLKAAKIQILSAILFIAGFYLLLVGSKIAVALLVGKSRRFLKSAYYINIIRVLGLFLIGFALVLVKDGLFYFGLF